MKIKNTLARLKRRNELKKAMPKIREWFDKNIEDILTNKTLVERGELGEKRSIGFEINSVSGKREYRMLCKVDVMIVERELK